MLSLGIRPGTKLYDIKKRERGQLCDSSERCSHRMSAGVCDVSFLGIPPHILFGELTILMKV